MKQIRRLRERRRSARLRGSRRLFDVLLALAILAALALIVARMQSANKVEMTGIARVIDGDTIQIGIERIRLYGIDAPELAQMCRRQEVDYACGQRAREALAAISAQGPAECKGGERDRYRRLLMRCRVNEVDVNRKLVEMGWAVSYGAYRDAESTARAAKNGLWSGEFERPAEWRVIHGAMGEDEHGGIGAFWRRLVARFIDGPDRY